MEFWKDCFGGKMRRKIYMRESKKKKNKINKLFPFFSISLLASSITVWELAATFAHATHCRPISQPPTPRHAPSIEGPSASSNCAAQPIAALVCGFCSTALVRHHSNRFVYLHFCHRRLLLPTLEVNEISILGEFYLKFFI